MNRKQIIEFCKEKVFPLVPFPQASGMDCFEVVRMVGSWRAKNGWPDHMEARVDDGFLFINGTGAGRIAPKAPKVKFCERAYYWEGKCLAKAGL